ncbi:MAG: urea carboxylase-associated family protein [Proteobacteria bacterium]|nr:MAG: urea carboxylase-associated family protein [Pseudomonadota bacterium]
MAHTIAPQTGAGFRLKKGERLRVTDPNGEQVSDLFCFSDGPAPVPLSSGRSIDYADTMLFTKGHHLYSYAGIPMLEILEDSCGRHDFLVTPCSLHMFQMLGGNDEYHPSCQENLEKALSPFGLDVRQIGTTFNIFMNIPFKPDGSIRVEKPLSKAGDYILFEAKMDLIVGLTACSDEGTNNGSCKPISYEIIPARAL